MNGTQSYQVLTMQSGTPHHFGRPIVAQVGVAVRHDVSQLSEHYVADGGCVLFEFILNVLLTGSLCAVGFVGNTLSLVSMWHQRKHTATTFLLQAVLIADTVVIWALFIEDVVPALGYVVPILSDCESVCRRVSAATRPLLTFAQSCTLWLTLCVALGRYVLSTRPARASTLTSLDSARKMAALVLVCSLLVVLPLTFDSSVSVAHIHLDTQQIHVENLRDNLLYRRVYQYGVLHVLTVLLPWTWSLYVGVRLGRTLHSIKRMKRSARAVTSQTHDLQDNTQALQVALTLCITLLVCYLPAVVQGVVFWARADSLLRCGHIYYYLTHFSNMFRALHAALKLLIFCLFQPSFSRLVRDNFCRHHCCYGRNSRKGRMDNDHFYGIHCRDISEMTLMSHTDEPAEHIRA